MQKKCKPGLVQTSKRGDKVVNCVFVYTIYVYQKFKLSKYISFSECIFIIPTDKELS